MGKARERVHEQRNAAMLLCACVWSSHLAALAQAAQQQGGVGGSDAVLHVFACMLQSCNTTHTHTGQQISSHTHAHTADSQPGAEEKRRELNATYLY